MLNKFDDINVMKKFFLESKMGMWVIELEEDKPPRMYANEMMLELLGLDKHPSPEECYSTWYDNIEEAYYPKVKMTVEKIIGEGRAEVEYPWNHPKLGKIFIRCWGAHDCEETKNTNIVKMRGFHQNVTYTMTLRKENEYLQELNEEILSSFHKIFFGVYRVSPKMNLVEALKTTDDISNMIRLASTFTSYLELSIETVMHPDDKLRLKEELSPENMVRLKEKGIDHYTTECRRKFDDEYRWVLITVLDSSAKTSGDWRLVTLQDIHEQKCKEEEKNRVMVEAYETAQKANKAKSEFLSRMSHDIRTPMNAITGMTTLAIAHMEDRERLLDNLNKIKISTKLMAELINEVLDMSKIESGTYELNMSGFKLSSLIQSLVSIAEPVIHEKKQSLSVSIGKIRHENLLGDVMRIQQVMMNIISNANKYTPDGGHISLSVEEISDLGEQYGRFRFAVRDDGIGMEQEFLKNIFEPFTRAEDSRISKTSGTGLGMAIANNIIQLMGGTIQVESELGKGSIFTVVLNLQLQDEDSNHINLEEKETDIKELHFDGKYILLADDNNINLEIAKEILQMTGAIIETASDGKEALETFKNAPQNHFSAIFLDIQMPVMDGNEAAVSIRSLDRMDAQRVPIIAMTANAFVEDILLSKQSGMNEHIAKPIDIGKLAAVLKKWM